MQHVLPRHLEIILPHQPGVSSIFAREVPAPATSASSARPVADRRERPSAAWRMANLSIVGSHKVNGVSALHSDLLVKTIFSDFAALWPDRFTPT